VGDRRRRHPRAHWGLLAISLAVVLVLVAVQGLTTRTIGASRTPVGHPTAAAPLAGRPSILAGAHLTGRSAPRREIALTFDDGPDPRWTPRIAATLRRAHVPATFFVVGANVARNAGLIAALHRDGFELGSHTFTHADLARLSPEQLGLQLNLTDAAVAAAAGVRPRLLRPPYSATPDAITPDQLRALQRVTARGYVVALSDFDSRDWERPGVGDIVRAATPPNGRGGVMLMHDGGGNRSQTVAALARLVPRLRARGYRFVTVSQLAALPRAQVELPVAGWPRTRARGLLAALTASRALTTALFALVITSTVLLLLRAAILVAFARHHVRTRRPVAQAFAPPVSVVMPAYNEAVGIERAIRSLLDSDYPELEIVVVDDGSTDDTAERVDSLADPRVRLLRQDNAGKAAALNRGVVEARHGVVVMVDADTVFEPGTLTALVAPMHDPLVGAVAGNTKVGNRRGIIGHWQHLEYVMGFNLDRRLYDVLRCMPTVPGAIGAFRRAAVADAGGVSTATLAEDTDLTLSIARAGWLVVYAEDARAWTEAPSTLGALWRQRYRWSYGTMQAVWKHRRATRRLSDPAERRVGLVGLPYLVLFQILLPLGALFIDPLTVYGLVFLDPLPILAFWLGFNLVSLAVALYAFRLDRESPKALWALPLQQFVYRQLTYLVVTASVVTAIEGRRMPWLHVERTGDVEVAP
jgi:cellulose synthase/poly-beta-1,6-N-acetylglucosamine synthase-like glycosyltransferase/peptidoglycan/xylan/chitin deacetylase (PgdA/CDA1 family)